MVKPFLYHSFKEKAQLERKLFASVPLKARERAWQTISEIFYRAGLSKRRVQSKKRTA